LFTFAFQLLSDRFWLLASFGLLPLAQKMPVAISEPLEAMDQEKRR
jgi:hypothetical protein